MASDYSKIHDDNVRRYGTDIGRIGSMLLAERYDDRTHFIFELLQNAEDAIGRRLDAEGQRSVHFRLAHDELRVSHFGRPFDDSDVRGICGIAQSTKDPTAIGRFGIGFKSVYAFTERPEIHSGTEAFAIENFVRPAAVPSVAREPNETIIVIPLKTNSVTDRDEITAGLQRLSARTLLFLRQIDEIEWSVEHGPSGIYLRSQPEELGDGVRRITVIGEEEGKAEVEETWLLFSKPVVNADGVRAGHVELAFSVAKDEKSMAERIAPIHQSPLVVYFPTVVETHLGFLVQGPYRTTPSRDNVPRNDEWNQHCVQETSNLLIDALRWLRDNGLLNTSTLRCLPLNREKFGAESMFAPLFEATKEALTTEALLPGFGGGHVTARACKLARTQEARELFDPAQLGALFGYDEDLTWLSGDISQDRTPELQKYLIDELEIGRITPDTILSHLDSSFLEAQTDEWVLRLYEFLNGQPALRQKASVSPLIRLVDGTHIKARKHGRSQAFLPGSVETDFPTVRKSVCSTEAAISFLRTLGLNEPDAVDDVVQNVLPKYHTDKLEIDDIEYDADIRRIVAAFATDSEGQRVKLRSALSKTSFVMAVDAGDASKHRSKPKELYLATNRLKQLFAGISGVLLVDDQHSCLRGEAVRDLLEDCGAVRYMRPIEDRSLSWEEQRRLRIQTGQPQTSRRNDRITDWMLFGLKDLIESLKKLDIKKRRKKAMLLWDELAHLEERRGKGVFTGKYTWTYYGNYSAQCNAAFVRMLNSSEWIPDADGNLQRPRLTDFDSLDWKQSPFLLSKIQFKDPLVDQLAKKAGIEPGVLDLLKRHEVTSVDELVARLGLEEKPSQEDEVGGSTKSPVSPVQDPAQPSDAASTGRGVPAEPAGGGTRRGAAGREGRGKDRTAGSEKVGTKRTPGSPGGRPFISYLGTHHNQEDPDPDALDQQARMALETWAIELILSREPNWQRTPAFNPGYDLFEGEPEKPNRWCEVKAMTGGLTDRPVGLSRTQFECASEHGTDYWLYIVEHAGGENARIVRIQDPAGKARTFTFDHGWISVAELDGTAD